MCIRDSYNDVYEKYNYRFRISRYALGKDYHIVVYEKLKKLLDFIKQQDSEVQGRIYVDTGPLFEKIWAQKAGIGWIGKNTCLITREAGSWVFLGEILINKQLNYDKPEENRCNDCNLCIKQCPTGALTEPFVLNSNLCISYLTIENKGDIPAYLWKKVYNRIFGCDTCQEVCPWNIRQKQTDVSEFSVKKEILNYSIDDFLNLDKEAFNDLFKNSPIKRAGYNGFIRNVKIVKENEKIIFNQ